MKNYVEFRDDIGCLGDSSDWVYQDIVNPVMEGCADEKHKFLKKELAVLTDLSPGKVERLVFGPSFHNKLCDYMKIAYCAGYRIKLEKIKK
jgi:hypothetical protein